jgi:hypothetical protein
MATSARRHSPSREGQHRLLVEVRVLSSVPNKSNYSNQIQIKSNQIKSNSSVFKSNPLPGGFDLI